MSELTKLIKGGKIAKVNWCGKIDCENNIKFKTGGAKSLNMPLNQQPRGNCVCCKEKANAVSYFAKSY